MNNIRAAIFDETSRSSGYQTVMHQHPWRTSGEAVAERAAVAEPAKDIYFALSSSEIPAHALQHSRHYLEQQLQMATRLQADLPGDLHDLPDWLEAHTGKIGRQYQQYLEERKAGAARRYFTNKSHALNFLQSVAPTKLADGSWLYGLVKHWDDARFGSFIRIYLEELGTGVPEKNHVFLYGNLLARYGCEQWRDLSDGYFVQGAIQLSLAHNAD